MLNANVINTLSGLLLLTSLLVIETRKPRQSAMFYSLQSLILVLIFVALATLMNAPQLYWWAASAFVTKAVLVPLILYRALAKVDENTTSLSTVSTPVSLLLVAVAVAVSYTVVSQIQLKAAAVFIPALAISVAHFFFGQICIVTHRNLFKQILGFCLMENGSHLTLALLAFRAPELVEVGIATDAVFAVIVLVLLAGQIYKSLHTLDSAELKVLKG
ncbi:MAG TPA: hydrogenase 4 membrane subunit [Anaerolineales bacterium]|nr:hydrogenase 4 membrane subunit [Anaerolineales bacterium]